MVKSPYNTKSTLVAINAKDADIPYLFFQDSGDLQVVVVQKNISIIRANRVAKEVEKLDEDRVVNRFLNILNETKFQDAIAAYLSTKGISFLVKKDKNCKKVLNFNEFNLQDTLAMMKSHESRSKLLTNFENKYKDIYNKLNETNYNLFETISVILDLKYNGFDSLSDKALEFRGNGGLKIDMFFDDNGVDYGALLGSIMSFRIAGAEDYFIAYSFFEALGDMAINTLNQLKKEFMTDNIVMMGDMFSNSVLYSRILSKYSLAKPYFSKITALDD
jgi:hydrogenase maturation factor HypF (carbamoyltransferase family)